MSSIKRLSLNVGSGGLVFPAAFARHSASVILSHGLGDSAEGLEDLATMWREKMPYIKFIVPTASQRPVTINMGQHMNAWYNINGFDDRASDPCEGLEESSTFIHSLVDEELSCGVARSRIMLAGFSQGGALSLFTGLQRHGDDADPSFAGLLVLSGYLPKAHAFEFCDKHKGCPVLHCHGAQDPVVRYDWAEKTRDRLLQMGHEKYELKKYNGLQHSLSMDVVNDAAAFIAQCLPDSPEYLVPPPKPSKMSVKELKEALRTHCLTQKALGCTEKQEFVKVLEDFYREKGLDI